MWEYSVEEGVDCGTGRCCSFSEDGVELLNVFIRHDEDLKTFQVILLS